MKDELFSELMESAEEALDHARGKRELRTTVLPLPPEPMAAAEVKQLRARLNASQAVFARYLNVSTKLVQAWEAQRRRPDGAALKLLRVAERDPSAVFPDPGSAARPSADRPGSEPTSDVQGTDVSATTARRSGRRAVTHPRTSSRAKSKQTRKRSAGGRD